MSDDEIIGLKSTSIKFKKNIKLFVSTTYLISIIMMLSIFFNFLGINIFTIFFILFSLSLIYQLTQFDKNKKKNCLKLFKLNNFSGLLLFLGILFIN